MEKSDINVSAVLFFDSPLSWRHAWSHIVNGETYLYLIGKWMGQPVSAFILWATCCHLQKRILQICYLWCGMRAREHSLFGRTRFIPPEDGGSDRNLRWNISMRAPWYNYSEAKEDAEAYVEVSRAAWQVKMVQLLQNGSALHCGHCELWTKM